MQRKKAKKKTNKQGMFSKGTDSETKGSATCPDKSKECHPFAEKPPVSEILIVMLIWDRGETWTWCVECQVRVCDESVSKEHCLGLLLKETPQQSPCPFALCSVVRLWLAAPSTCGHATGFDAVSPCFFYKKLLKNSAQIRIQEIGFNMYKYIALWHLKLDFFFSPEPMNIKHRFLPFAFESWKSFCLFISIQNLCESFICMGQKENKIVF